MPISHQAFNGNTAESPTHLDNLKRLAQLLPKGELLYLAGSKLDAKENLLAVVAGKGKFLGGGAFTVDVQNLYRTVRDRLQALDYDPKSQADLPPAERDKDRGVEVAQTIRGLVDGKPVCCKYRLLLLGSEARARQEAATRQRHLDKIRAEFTHIEKNLNRYRLKTLDTAYFLRVSAALGRGAADDLQTWTTAFRAGCTAVAELGGADTGDRTMLDALLPALDAQEKGGQRRFSVQSLIDVAGAVVAIAALGIVE